MDLHIKILSAHCFTLEFCTAWQSAFSRGYANPSFAYPSAPDDKMISYKLAG